MVSRFFVKIRIFCLIEDLHSDTLYFRKAVKNALFSVHKIIGIGEVACGVQLKEKKT